MSAINSEHVTTLNIVRCNYCINKLKSGCKAFTVIPDSILTGKNNHSKIFASQKGHNNYVFTPEVTQRYLDVKEQLDKQK